MTSVSGYFTHAQPGHFSVGREPDSYHEDQTFLFHWEKGTILGSVLMGADNCNGSQSKSLRLAISAYFGSH